MHLRTVDNDVAALMLLKLIKATDQGRLAGPGWTANDDAFAAVDREVDIPQDLEVAVEFIDIPHLNHEVGDRVRRGTRQRRGCGHWPCPPVRPESFRAPC